MKKNAEPISYGRTTSRYITKETGLISYPASAIVVVFGKEVDFNGVDLWEVEVSTGTL